MGKIGEYIAWFIILWGAGLAGLGIVLTIHNPLVATLVILFMFSSTIMVNGKSLK